MVIFVNAQTMTKTTSSKSSTVCHGNCETKNKKAGLTCKLTTPELRERKETVIKSLKNQMLIKKEVKNGYSYKFAGTDKMVDELAGFVTELDI